MSGEADSEFEKSHHRE